MKWKKKGGKLRASIGEVQATIEIFEDGEAVLSFRGAANVAWLNCPRESLQEAKERGEKILTLGASIAAREKKIIENRRLYYESRPVLTPEQKTLKKAFEAYRESPEEERAEARLRFPVLCEEFDRCIKELDGNSSSRVEDAK